MRFSFSFFCESEIRIKCELTSSEAKIISGTETLVPFIKEKKNNDEAQPTIIVDSREASSAPKIIKGLIERGAKVKTQTF